jgi:predicted nucleotidyltransferase
VASRSEIEEILSLVAGHVAKIDGVAAIVLGGSRARGNADERSDIDLGIYYDGAHPFSTAALGAAAQELDDRHLDGLVTSFGQWGAAVNGGGWLEIRCHHVDFIYREIGAVREAIEDCIAGRPRSIYQLGPPLGFTCRFTRAKFMYAVRFLIRRVRSPNSSPWYANIPKNFGLLP